jgi:hypothetical protein
MATQKTTTKAPTTKKTSYTPSELAAELKVDAKRLRAYLRSTHTRNPEAKNTSWALSEAQARDVREHFKAKAETKKAES